jgi:hypothetical protein
MEQTWSRIMTVLAVSGSPLLIVFAIAYMSGLVVFLWLTNRSRRTSVRSTASFVYVVIFICIFCWIWAWLHSEPFLRVWPLLVFLILAYGTPFAASELRSRVHSLEKNLLIHRSIGAACGAFCIVLFVLDGGWIMPLAFLLIAEAVLWSFVLPRRLVRENWERETLKAIREWEAERGSENAKEQTGAKPE